MDDLIKTIHYSIDSNIKDTMTSSSSTQLKKLKTKNQVFSQQIHQQTVQQILQTCMKQCQFDFSCPLWIKSPSSSTYFVYHIQIRNHFYQQQWSICKRYSEFFRFKTSLITSSSSSCSCCFQCQQFSQWIKHLSFPKKKIFTTTNATVANQRIHKLCKFLEKLCQQLGSNETLTCAKFKKIYDHTKIFLHFPLDYEQELFKALSSLTYYHASEIEQEVACVICLSNIGLRSTVSHQMLIVKSNCGHLFHQQCLYDWFKKRFDCPMCRSIQQ